MNVGFNSAILIAGGVVLALSLVAGYFKNKLWIGESLICILLGTFLGPHVSGLVDPDKLPVDKYFALEELARLTLCIAVMAAALRMPRHYLSNAYLSVAMAIGPLMLCTWAASAAAAYFVLQLPLLLSLLIGAALAPTDPVVAGAIVNGKVAKENVPARMRNLLTAESGANDGLALLFVMLPILLIGETARAAWTEWLVRVLIWEILGGAALGVLFGWGAGRLFKWARRQPVSEPQSIMTIALALSIVVLAATRLMGSDGILATFAAGVAFSQVAGPELQKQEHLQEAVERFFDLPVFVLIGIMLPWDAWVSFGWQGPAFSIAVLLLRRPLFWIIARRAIPKVASLNEAAFLGWFGPVGVSTIYYLTFSKEDAGTSILWEAGSMVAFVSVLIYGVSATPLARSFRAGRKDFHQERLD
ncbi:cation:proton antiporter [Rhizobium sp. L1K21]|uniref:cation:proton antiporter domain-containing protein n=1 Tax=Rhizobium sp. L1K21 TaxID=2954933 RepID=UPI0020921005|nr:cation:proton antiporter [Rhizobium sp. L1K21]MCO6187773.1 cation:proton antiporter [Rhizobium sp. L1K21]